MQTTIKNPILPGFHPDPSAIRVGDTYYVAVSTFEWYPGVEIFASKNLRDWESVARPLATLDLLDMRGEIASDGIWAPNLSYADGLFYLVYTDMKNSMNPAKDQDNYVITAKDIKGPWSKRIYLNSTGFDPALFHDDDGRKYVINMNMDWRPDHNRFGGILLQEYDPIAQKLIGKAQIILQPNDTVQEGSNLYKIDGYYYLMIADGGTGRQHATMLYRSKAITGPYLPDPRGFLLTSRFNPEHPIQKAGHSCLLSTPEGGWYLLHLGARPTQKEGRCTLGRECFLENLTHLDDGWFRLENGTYLAEGEVKAPFPLPEQTKQGPVEYHFDKTIPEGFFTLREPASKDCFDLTSRPGWLRMYGRRSLFSCFTQALLARRWEHFSFTATTTMDYESDDFHATAGLVALYDQENFHYLFKSYDEEEGREVLYVLTSDHNKLTIKAKQPIEKGVIALRLTVKETTIQGSYSLDGTSYQNIGPELDATILSDEYCQKGRFTGAMIGICAQDLTGRRTAADFQSFVYDPS